jgi:hypothetical protein
MIGYLLFLIGRTLAILLMPLGLAYTIIRRLFLRIPIGDYFFSLGYVYDVLINVCYGDLFNDIFGKWNKHPYGKRTDTISRVLGKNERTNDLIKLEKRVVKFLDWLDKEHTKKASQ